MNEWGCCQPAADAKRCPSHWSINRRAQLQYYQDTVYASPVQERWATLTLSAASATRPSSALPAMLYIIRTNVNTQLVHSRIDTHVWWPDHQYRECVCVWINGQLLKALNLVNCIRVGPIDQYSLYYTRARHDSEYVFGRFMFVYILVQTDYFNFDCRLLGYSLDTYTAQTDIYAYMCVFFSQTPIAKEKIWNTQAHFQGK